jgi:hypothetical protein
MALPWAWTDLPVLVAAAARAERRRRRRMAILGTALLALTVLASHKLERDGLDPGAARAPDAAAAARQVVASR